MSPALPSRDGSVRLAGTIRNTSELTLTGLQAVLWRSLDPIEDTEGMERALVSASNEPLGSRVQPTTIFENIPSDDDRTLAPDEETTFNLTADIADLGLLAEDAVYLIGVQIRGQIEDGGNDLIVGRGRIFMPLVDNPRPDASVQLTSVVLLASRPSLVRTGLLSDDHLAGEVAPGGRLRVLLDAAKQPGVSFAVDPALIEELETMRRGYQVVDEDEDEPDEEVSPGTGSAAAGRWLEEFNRLRVVGDGFRVLYGNPDLAALIRSSQQNVVAASVAAGEDVAATRALPLLVLPGGGRADVTTVAAAENTNARAVLLSENSARGPGPLLAGAGNAPIVSYSATALGGGPGPIPKRTPAKVRQRALAETWLTADAATEGEPTAQVWLIKTAAQAASIPADRTPWVTATPLSTLLRKTPAEWDQAYTYGPKAVDVELTDAQLDEVRRLADGFTTYTDLLVEPSRAEAQEQATLPRAASSSWRGVRRGFTRYTSAVGRELDEILDDAVSISVNPRVLTTGRAATFPITVRNGLPASADDPQLNTIRVVLRFRSENSQRLTVAPIELQPIQADSARTENAQVQAETNGAVQVTAEVVTRSDRRVGESVPIEVNATQAGTMGWIIAIAAGIVLIGTTALRIRQVAKERSATGPEPVPEPVAVSRPVESAENPPPTETRDPLDV
jgi:hypothetical protein